MRYHVSFHKEEKNPCIVPANKNNSIWGLNFWLSPFPSTLVFGFFFLIGRVGVLSDPRPTEGLTQDCCRSCERWGSCTNLKEHRILLWLWQWPDCKNPVSLPVTVGTTVLDGKDGPPNNVEFGIHSSKHRALNLSGRVHGWRLRSQLTFAIFRQNSLSSSQWKYSMSPFCGALVGRTGSPLSITSPTYPLTPHLLVPACPYSTQLFILLTWLRVVNTD